jgi:hypothetical protein
LRDAVAQAEKGKGVPEAKANDPRIYREVYGPGEPPAPPGGRHGFNIEFQEQCNRAVIDSSNRQRRTHAT